MTTFFIFGILKNYEKIQMEFEQMVDALEFKLQPKVFIEYSSTLRAHLGLFGFVWAHLGLFRLVWAHFKPNILFLTSLTHFKFIALFLY